MQDQDKHASLASHNINKDILILALAGILTLVIDLTTKRWFEIHKGNWDFQGWLNFSLLHNHGMFLGTGSAMAPILRNVSLTTIGAFLIFVYTIILYLIPIRAMVLRVGLTLMLAGIIGNVIDRIAFGYVIDFISFRFGSYTSPVFNLADAAQLIGSVGVFASLIYHQAALWPVQDFRKSYWISPQYQLRFCMTLIVVSFAFVLIAGTFAYTFLKVTLSNSRGFYMPRLTPEAQMILNNFLAGFTLMTIAFLAVLTWIGIRLSHEVAGPMFAFQRFLSTWLSGDTTATLQLRKNDRFKADLEALAQSLNEYTLAAAAASSGSDDGSSDQASSSPSSEKKNSSF